MGLVGWRGMFHSRPFFHIYSCAFFACMSFPFCLFFENLLTSGKCLDLFTMWTFWWKVIEFSEILHPIANLNSENSANVCTIYLMIQTAPDIAFDAVQECAIFWDLGECCKMSVCLWKSASIQPRTSLPKFLWNGVSPTGVALVELVGHPVEACAALCSH